MTNSNFFGNHNAMKCKINRISTLAQTNIELIAFSLVDLRRPYPNRGQVKDGTRIAIRSLVEDLKLPSLSDFSYNHLHLTHLNGHCLSISHAYRLCAIWQERGEAQGDMMVWRLTSGHPIPWVRVYEDETVDTVTAETLALLA